MTENPTRRDMMERNYAKAAIAIQTLIEEEGCCNALKPYSDALEEIQSESEREEINVFYAQQVLSIVSGLFDINFKTTTGADRMKKIRETIRFLQQLEKEHEA